MLTIRIVSSMWPNGASPPTCFWLSKGRLCKENPCILSQAHLIGPFASKNVTLTLIMSKKNLKCPLSLKPTTVHPHFAITAYSTIKVAYWLLVMFLCYLQFKDKYLQCIWIDKGWIEKPPFCKHSIFHPQSKDINLLINTLYTPVAN